MHRRTISRIASYLAFPVLLLSTSPSTTLAANPSVTINSTLSQSTVLPGTSIAFTVAASGFTAPTYSVRDSFSSSGISNSNITNTGDFSWIPRSSDVGTHSITITVSDLHASRSATITIVVASSLSVGVVRFGPPYPSTTLTAGQTLTFWTVAAGFPERPYEALSDTFANSSLSNGNLDDTQQFTWTTKAQDVGTHTITLTANDREDDVASQSITVTVNPDPNAPAATVSNPPPSTPAPTTATTTPVIVFTQYLIPGSKNAQVLALQKMLASLGLLKATPNGYFGVGTENAVLAFQKAHQLTQLGVVGPATRAALNRIAASSTPAVTQTQSQPSSLAQQLADLQAKLAALTGH